MCNRQMNPLIGNLGAIDEIHYSSIGKYLKNQYININLTKDKYGQLYYKLY